MFLPCQVNEERNTLMQRLKDALQTTEQCCASTGSGSTNSGSAAAIAAAANAAADPNSSLTDILCMGQLADQVLNSSEYHELSEAIDANMAREDGIMILFDYAIGRMFDDVQKCQGCVSSWPFFPLMGSICAWLVEGPEAAEALSDITRAT
jgi:hypothetical protein